MNDGEFSSPSSCSTSMEDSTGTLSVLLMVTMKSVLLAFQSTTPVAPTNWRPHGPDQSGNLLHRSISPVALWWRQSFQVTLWKFIRPIIPGSDGSSWSRWWYRYAATILFTASSAPWLVVEMEVCQVGLKRSEEAASRWKLLLDEEGGRTLQTLNFAPNRPTFLWPSSYSQCFYFSHVELQLLTLKYNNPATFLNLL